MFDVMMPCRNGTSRFGLSHGDGAYWEENFSTITWCHERDFEAAQHTVRELRAGDPLRKEIKDVWIVAR